MWMETRIFTGTDFGDTQGEAVFSGSDLQTDSGTTLATPPPIRPEPSPFGNRPLGVNQPSQAMDSPEPPCAVQVSRAASVQGRHHGDGDSSAGPAATTDAVTHAVAAPTETDSIVEEPHE
jgi:hypothetical protein